MAEKMRHFVKPEKMARHRGHERSSERLQSQVQVVRDAEKGEIITFALGEKSVAVNDYLPQGVAFTEAEDEKFVYEFGYQEKESGQREHIEKIYFSKQRLETLSGRLALLHEIGHALYGRSGRSPHDRYYRYLIHVADKIIDSIRASQAYRAVEESTQKRDYFVEQFKEQWKREGERRVASSQTPLRYDELTSAINDLAVIERGAWAEALQLRRRIQNERNLDILDGAQSTEIFPEIEAIALQSYERAYEPLWELVGEDAHLPRRGWFDRLFDYLEKEAIRAGMPPRS